MFDFDELEQGFSEAEARAEARHEGEAFRFATSVTRLHGDMAHEPQTLILAMREGRRVAAAIDALLRRG